jgi:hypothetical protein
MLLRTNAKLSKNSGEAAPYLLAGLTLAPYTLSGHQACSGSSVGCRASCNLWFSGQRVTPQARNRALEDTEWLFESREGLIRQLHRDISKHVERAHKSNLIPLIRLNVASDLDWIEKIAEWPDVAFFDYTKIRSRFFGYLKGKLPSNYHLTFSRHEKHDETMIAEFLSAGGNVAHVFDVPYHPQSGTIGELPKLMKIDGREFPVIDADLHDVRLPKIDGTGVIVGLRLKGTNAAKQRARKSGCAS